VGHFVPHAKIPFCPPYLGANTNTQTPFAPKNQQEPKFKVESWLS